MTRRKRFALGMAEHLVDLLGEIAGVLKMPVNAREADISDLVQLAQVLHDPFADKAAFDLGFEHRIDIRLDLGDQRRDPGAADRPFPAGPFDALPDFLRIERNTRAVPFDDTNRDGFRPFVGREPLVATAAIPSPPDGRSVITRPGIDDLVIINTAKWTFHNRPFPRGTEDRQVEPENQWGA